MVHKTSLTEVASRYGLILFISTAFVLSCHVHVEIFFFFGYFHGFFIYMAVDSAFRDWSVMIVVWFFSGLLFDSQEYVLLCQRLSKKSFIN